MYGEEIGLKQARKFLEAPSRCDRLILAYMDELEHTRDMIAKANAVFSTDVAREFNPHKREDAVLHYMWLKETLEELIIETVSCKAKVFFLMGKIENEDELELVLNRYIRKKSWEKINESMGIKGEKSIFKLHNRLLRTVVNILKADTK